MSGLCLSARFEQYAGTPTENAKQQGRMPSFIETLHSVPTLLGILPPTAFKALSATCRSLRTYFCAQVMVISLSNAEDASKLCCTAWPQLLMVVCASGAELGSQLSAQWQYMLEMSVCDASMQGKTAVLIRPWQQSGTPLMDLPRQHSAALSAFADKHRHLTEDLRWGPPYEMKLRGPFMSCSVAQSLMHNSWPTITVLEWHALPQREAESVSWLSSSLPNLTGISFRHCFIAASDLLRFGTSWSELKTISLAHNQLDASSISAIPQASWPHLRYLELGHNMISTAGVQHLVDCSWPCLQVLSLTNTGIDGAALRCLAQGHWPELCLLDLVDNNIDAIGASYLIQGNWPLLTSLVLSAQGLDEETCFLLGVAYPGGRTIGMSLYKSRLHQFPNLKVGLVH